MLKNFAILSNFIDFLLLIILAFVLTVSIFLFLDTQNNQPPNDPPLYLQELQTDRKPADFSSNNYWSSNHSLLSNLSQVNPTWLNPFFSFYYFKNCIYLPRDNNTTTVQCWFSILPLIDSLKFWLIESNSNQSMISNTSLIGKQENNLTDLLNITNRVTNDTDQVGKVNTIKNVSVHLEKAN